jgi:hypothetical protein
MTHHGFHQRHLAGRLTTALEFKGALVCFCAGLAALPGECAKSLKESALHSRQLTSMANPLHWCCVVTVQLKGLPKLRLNLCLKHASTILLVLYFKNRLPYCATCLSA